MTPASKHGWFTIEGTVIQGHQVASGSNGDRRFPDGTIRMQRPYFAAHGFRLDHIHPATLNLSIAPRHFRILRPLKTIRNLHWHPTEPPETFSFCDCRIQAPDRTWLSGYIYHPHPETKPGHFQPPGVLEILAPRMDGIHYGLRLTVELKSSQMAILDSTPDA